MKVWMRKPLPRAQYYHQEDCSVLDRMENPKQVDKDYAEWKGADPCKQCHNNSATPHGKCMVTCAFCGSEMVSYREHLPECEEA